jgi:hypothetical protein
MGTQFSHITPFGVGRNTKGQADHCSRSPVFEAPTSSSGEPGWGCGWQQGQVWCRSLPSRSVKPPLSHPAYHTQEELRTAVCQPRTLREILGGIGGWE